jgi:hypothetical protein
MIIIVVQDLLTFTEADIKDLGVKNSAHRARVVSSLVALRMKHEKGKWHRSVPEDIHYCVLYVCFLNTVPWEVGLDSVVGIATDYGLDVPGIESRLGARFSAPVQTGPRPTQSPVKWVPGLYRE